MNSNVFAEGVRKKSMTSIQKVLGSNPAGSQIFFRAFLSHSLSNNIIMMKAVY